MLIWPRKKTQTTRIRSERGDITTDLTKRFINEGCKQLYPNKLDNLDEIGKFLEQYTLHKFTWKEIYNLLKRPITRNWISHQKLPTKKSSGRPQWFHCWFYHPFKEYQFSTNSSKKQKRMKHFPNHSMKLVLPWYQNLTNTLQENYRPISLKNMDAKSPTNTTI